MIRKINEFEITLASPHHSRAIAELLSKVQSDHTLPLTIWSSDRAEHFVSDVIEAKKPQPGMRFYVATKAAEVHGAFCIREMEGRIFFDNIFVTPLFREKQMAAPFIVECCEHYHQTELGSNECAWDVWSHQRLLVMWYMRLGGRETLRKNWFEIPSPARVHETAISIAGLEDADRQHDRYGFSMLNVVTPGGAFRVGRLGNHAYRLTDRRTIEDQGLLSALAAHDSKRTFYANLPADDDSALFWGEPIATSIRMHAGLSKFLQQLRKQIPQVITA